MDLQSNQIAPHSSEIYALAHNETRINLAKQIVSLKEEVRLLKAKIEDMELEEMARAIVFGEDL